MTSTDSLPESEDVPDRAVGYMRPTPPSGAGVRNDDTLPWRGTAAGGGYSTVGDLLRFAQALNSGSLISTTMLDEATRPHQQHYGYGFTTEYHVERMYRDAKLCTIGEGTSEVQRLVISREILRDGV